MTTLLIRQRRSAIGEKAAAKGTLSALGLGKPGAHAAHDDSVTVRGMLRRVAHLVEVTETDDAGTAKTMKTSDERAFGPRGPLPPRREERVPKERSDAARPKAEREEQTR